MRLNSFVRSEGDTRFVLAGPEDDGAICRFLASQSMDGKGMSMVTRTEPSFFAAARLMGDDPQVMVAKRVGEIVGLGVRTKRAVRIGGEVRTVGHLSYLRLGEAVRGRRDFLRDGYRMLRELQRADPVAFHLTAILDDNVAAKRLLEAGLPGLPRYSPLAAITTVVFSSGRVIRKKLVRELPEVYPDDLWPFMKSTWASQELAPPMATVHPFTYLACVREGKDIVAAAGLWDQRYARQVAFANMSVAGKAVLPFINVLRGIVGKSPIPREGKPLNLGYISNLAVAEDATVDAFIHLMRLVATRARQKGIDFLTLSLPSQHRFTRPFMVQLGEHVIGSTLYAVHWEDDAGCPPLASLPYVEAALL